MCPARLSERACRVWSWLAVGFSAWRDAVVSSSETTPFPCELRARWLSFLGQHAFALDTACYPYVECSRPPLRRQQRSKKRQKLTALNLLLATTRSLAFTPVATCGGWRVPPCGGSSRSPDTIGLTTISGADHGPKRASPTSDADVEQDLCWRHRFISLCRSHANPRPHILLFSPPAISSCAPTGRAGIGAFYRHLHCGFESHEPRRFHGLAEAHAGAPITQA